MKKEVLMITLFIVIVLIVTNIFCIVKFLRLASELKGFPESALATTYYHYSRDLLEPIKKELTTLKNYINNNRDGIYKEFQDIYVRLEELEKTTPTSSTE